MDGGVRDNYFHGWPNNTKYNQCFVFKWKENSQHHRLYGFLYHPLPYDNRRLVVCVLASHARKKEFETDDRELDRIMTLRADAEVAEAMRPASRFYKE